MNLTPQEEIDYIKVCAENLCRHAASIGLNLTISREPVKPLAMGNAVYAITVWPARKLAMSMQAERDRACMDAFNDEYHKVPPAMSIDEWSALWDKGETPPQKRAAAATQAQAGALL